ncbi:hypothetical protein B0H11DRAFT_1905475 [Mycena galericulata]|nr:hypothetical protein B0H11DRAFT_1905475 [Mycena galericulata]
MSETWFGEAHRAASGGSGSEGRSDTTGGGRRRSRSAIDTWKLGDSARLATEVVGATRLFHPLGGRGARLRVHPPHRHRPHRAAKRPPRVPPAVDVALVLAVVAEPGNNTQAERDALAAQSVALLQDIPPTQTDRVDTTARFAALLCWWPRWITGAYPALLLRSVEGRVRAQLTPSRTRNPGVKVERAASDSGVVHTPSSSPRKAPYSVGRPITVKREEE